MLSYSYINVDYSKKSTSWNYYCKLMIIYEDKNLIAVNKPAGTIVFPEGNIQEETLIDHLIKDKPELKDVGEPKRYGVIHRLDKDTSGVILIAKNNETLESVQKEFQERRVVKKYITLVSGPVKEDGELITTLGRSPRDRRKQKVFDISEEADNKRRAETKYTLLKEFQDYTLLEVEIKTGRKHQIRAHMAHLQHPIAGDNLYGFKNQKTPKGLSRQFLHSKYLKINVLGKEIEFEAELPKDLKKILEELK
jgi:23S rRNA pseudouridine1911/1915/1917 synthase